MPALIVVVPVATLVAKPPEVIVATPASDEFQVTWSVRFSVDPSLKLPVAVKRWVLPSAMLGLAGKIVIEVSVAVPTSPANKAVTVAVPALMPLAMPFVPPLSPTVATDAGDEAHEADCVRSCEVPSAKPPIARS